MEEEYRKQVSEFLETISKRCSEIMNHKGMLTNMDVMRIVYEELSIPLVPEDFEKYGYSWQMEPAIIDNGHVALRIEP